MTPLCDFRKRESLGYVEVILRRRLAAEVTAPCCVGSRNRDRRRRAERATRPASAALPYAAMRYRPTLRPVDLDQTVREWWSNACSIARRISACTRLESWIERHVVGASSERSVAKIIVPSLVTRSAVEWRK